MRTNFRRDNAVTASVVIGVLLCAAAAFLGVWLSARSGQSYAENRLKTVFVDSAEGLEALGDGNGLNIILTNDIVIRDEDVCLGGEKGFSGAFNGNGHTVKMLYPTAYHGGLFGAVAAKGVVEDVRIEYARVRAAGRSFSGIAAINRGVVKNCSVVIEALQAVEESGVYAGAVGANYGSVENVIAECSLSKLSGMSEGKMKFGGIAAYNSGSIKGCIAKVKFSGIDCVNEKQVLMGESVNERVAAICPDLLSGSCDGAVAIVEDGVYVADMASKAVSFEKDEKAVFVYDRIFNRLGFDMRYWNLSEYKLNLIVREGRA